MKYTDLSPEEFQDSIIEPIADRLICLAHGNADFQCSDCLETIEVLEGVLRILDGEFAETVFEEVNEILER